MAELLDSVKNNTRKTTSREKNFLELYTTSIALFNNALQELWGDEYFENVDNHSDDNQEWLVSIRDIVHATQLGPRLFVVVLRIWLSYLNNFGAGGVATDDL